MKVERRSCVCLPRRSEANLIPPFVLNGSIHELGALTVCLHSPYVDSRPSITLNGFNDDGVGTPRLPSDVDSTPLINFSGFNDAAGAPTVSLSCPSLSSPPEVYSRRRIMFMSSTMKRDLRCCLALRHLLRLLLLFANDQTSRHRRSSRPVNLEVAEPSYPSHSPSPWSSKALHQRSHFATTHVPKRLFRTIEQIVTVRYRRGRPNKTAKRIKKTLSGMYQVMLVKSILHAMIRPDNGKGEQKVHPARPYRPTRTARTSPPPRQRTPPPNATYPMW